MKLKLLSRRMSVSAPRMTVRTHVPFYVRAGIIAAVLIGVAIVSVVLHRAYTAWGADTGLGPDEIHALRQKAEKLDAENASLRSAAAAAETKLKMEEVARAELSKQLKIIEAENARVKADLAFFEGFVPADSGVGSVAVQRLALEREPGSDSLRFRALIIRNGKSDKDFVGKVQLSVSALVDGKLTTLAYPLEGAVASDWAVRFKRYQRVEGSVPILANIVVKSAELKVLEGNIVRARLNAVI